MTKVRWSSGSVKMGNGSGTGDDGGVGEECDRVVVGGEK